MSRREQLDERLTLARYKRMILMGRVRVPLEEARRLVGPDCAYHLYYRHTGEDAGKHDRQSRRGTGRRPPGRRHK